MFRIDNSSAVPALPIAGPPGTPGFFTDGNPAAALEATIVDGWWLNMLQEEILTVVTEAGITPSKSSYRQLYDAIVAIAAGSVSVGGFLPLIGGYLHNPGNSDPLNINADNGLNARIGFNALGTRSWYAGVAANGNFQIYDQTAPGNRLAILAASGDLNIAAGNLQLNRSGGDNYAWIMRDAGAPNLGFSTVAGGQLANFYVSSANTTFTGDLTASQLAITGAAYFGSPSPSWINNGQLAIVDITAHGNVSVSGQFTANQNAQINGNCGVAGLLTGGNIVTPGECRVNGDLVSNHNITAGGGGVYVSAGTLTVVNSLIANVGGGTNLFGGVNLNTGDLFVSENVTVIGTIYGTVQPVCDLQLKQNVVDYRRSLDAVLQLQPVTFEFNGRAGTPQDGRTRIGFIADDVAGVMPEAVGATRLDDDGEDLSVKTLDTMALTAALVSAVKELAAKVEALEARR